MSTRNSPISLKEHRTNSSYDNLNQFNTLKTLFLHRKKEISQLYHVIQLTKKTTIWLEYKDPIYSVLVQHIRKNIPYRKLNSCKTTFTNVDTNSHYDYTSKDKNITEPDRNHSPVKVRVFYWNIHKGREVKNLFKFFLTIIHKKCTNHLESVFR